VVRGKGRIEKRGSERRGMRSGGSVFLELGIF
jgi:hypothetical protein